ncbi:hypothetical protein PR048_019404 [Dryococelus australis]|uniref:Uncharacterized protein n=1 Tax=Dryococelus australis TaxID=614101 RepID=A0ABQ9H3E9_9NEOP|nr:hypothetical protein PR048_019404 [Dryococelus australis]
MRIAKPHNPPPSAHVPVNGDNAADIGQCNPWAVFFCRGATKPLKMVVAQSVVRHRPEVREAVGLNPGYSMGADLSEVISYSVSRPLLSFPALNLGTELSTKSALSVFRNFDVVSNYYWDARAESADAFRLAVQLSSPSIFVIDVRVNQARGAVYNWLCPGTWIYNILTVRQNSPDTDEIRSNVAPTKSQPLQRDKRRFYLYFRRTSERTASLRNPRGNPPTSDIVAHDSCLRKSGSDPSGDSTRFASTGGEQSNRSATAAPRHLLKYEVFLRPCITEDTVVLMCGYGERHSDLLVSSILVGVTMEKDAACHFVWMLRDILTRIRLQFATIVSSNPENPMITKLHKKVVKVSIEQHRNERERGNGRSPTKPADLWHLPARFPHVNIGTDPAGNRALVGPGGRDSGTCSSSRRKDNAKGSAYLAAVDAGADLRLSGLGSVVCHFSVVQVQF